MGNVVHSHLGASGASRWMACTGSVTLARTLGTNDDFSNPEYRVGGTAAHEVASLCLKTDTDAWEHGELMYSLKTGMLFDHPAEECDKPLAPVSDLELECIQEYVDHCRAIRDRAHALCEDEDPKLACAREFIEHPIGEYEAHRPHPAFYGTVDYAMLTHEWLELADFKFGAGVSVDPENNPQVMYYAYGILLDIQRTRDIDPDFPVTIAIIQPRMWEEEPKKPWKTTAGEIIEWGRETLIPAMKLAESETKFQAGEHCRFCPAKTICPLLRGMFRVAATVNSSWLKDADPKMLAQEWQQIAPVKMYIKAVESETLGRMMLSQDLGDSIKLVHKRSDRVFKPEGIPIIKKTFGTLAFTEPELKSPAEIEKLGPDAKKLVKEWAYAPDTGLTVALASDKKPGVKVTAPAETFAHILAGMKGEEP